MCGSLSTCLQWDAEIQFCGFSDGIIDMHVLVERSCKAITEMINGLGFPLKDFRNDMQTAVIWSMEQLEGRSISARITPNTRADLPVLPELCNDIWLKIFRKLRYSGDLNVQQYAMPVCKEWRDLGYQLTAKLLHYSPRVERVCSRVHCLRLP